MALISMPQGKILMKLWLKIFPSKFSLLIQILISINYYYQKQFATNCIVYFLLESFEMDCKYILYVGSATPSPPPPFRLSNAYCTCAKCQFDTQAVVDR